MLVVFSPGGLPEATGEQEGQGTTGASRLYFIGFLRITRNFAPQVSSQVRGVASCAESVHSPHMNE